MQDTLNFEAARWLVRSIPRKVEIAWDDDEDERAMGSAWPRFIPYSRKTATWKPTLRGGRWLDWAGGRERDGELADSPLRALEGVGGEQGSERHL